MNVFGEIPNIMQTGLVVLEFGIKIQIFTKHICITNMFLLFRVRVGIWEYFKVAVGWRASQEANRS
jgi:hypothetical protein